MRIGHDRSPHEGIHPDDGFLKSQHGGVEDPRTEIVPVRAADLALIAINQFLPADFGREREGLGVTELQPGLLQIESVHRLGGIAPIPVAVSVPTGHESREPVDGRVTQMHFRAEEEVVVVVELARAQNL